MAQMVDVKGVGKVEFPDNMPRETMRQILQRKFSNAGKRAVGAAEGLASIASSAISEPISGLAGIAGAILPGESGQGAQWVDKTAQALTYQPRTATGQARLQDAGEALAPIGEVIEGASKTLGDKTYDATNSPMLAALAYSTPTALLEGLGVKGLGIARKPVSGADLYSARVGLGKIPNFRKPDFELDPSELADVGADVNNGLVTLYHRTTPEKARSIQDSGRFDTREDGVFFSTALDGQAKDYGSSVVKVKVPVSMLQLDDIFDGEAHVRVPMKKAGSIDLGQYIARDDVASSGPKSISDKYKQSGVESSITERSNEITLQKVIVPKEARGAGAGSKFMQDLVDYGNKSGKKISLTPSADFGGSKARLIEFYKRFGFVENKGKNKDFEVSEAMYKLPD
jgi:GNAT superfamily N-acetyltransferase